MITLNDFQQVSHSQVVSTGGSPAQGSKDYADACTSLWQTGFAVLTIAGLPTLSCVSYSLPHNNMPNRNQKQGTVNWRFTTDDARVKLSSLYPTPYLS
jgi:hypothetical protein